MRTMEHRDPRRLVSVKSQKGCVQLSRGGGIHGISDLGTVQRHHGHGPLLFNRN